VVEEGLDRGSRSAHSARCARRPDRPARHDGDAWPEHRPARRSPPNPARAPDSRRAPSRFRPGSVRWASTRRVSRRGGAAG
jgi:hypothetical protein